MNFKLRKLLVIDEDRTGEFTLPDKFAQTGKGRNFKSDFVWDTKSKKDATTMKLVSVNKVNTSSTVWAKKGSGASINLGSATRSGNYITKFVSVSSISPTPGFPIKFSLGVNYGGSIGTVYSSPSWMEVRLQSARQGARNIQPIGGGSSSSNSVLKWTSAITTANFPDLANTSITSSAHRSRIQNNTIAQIVSSQVIARDDNKKCSGCHYQTTSYSNYYKPTVSQGSTNSISRTANYNHGSNVSGSSKWSYSNGFASRFVQRHAGGSKPNPAFG